MVDSSTPTYSCIQDWTGGGTGNINSDPCFVDSANDDYHIQPISPCIDVGDPCGTYSGQTDIDGDDRVIDIGGIDDGNVDVDMGADEFNFGSLTVDFLNEPTGAQCRLIYNNEYYDGIWHDSGYQELELSPGQYTVRLKPTYSSSSGLWHTADDVTVDIAPGASETVIVWYWYPAVWVSDTRGDDNGDGGYDDPYQTIQYGIDNAQNVTGNVYYVLVEYETYYERIVLPDSQSDNRAIKLKGLNSGSMPNGDKPIVDGTGNSGYSTFELFHVAGGTLVENFYIANGKSTRTGVGGGMHIKGSLGGGGTCTVKNCIFDDNLANTRGGALYIEFRDPTIQDCVFKNNEVKYSPAQGGAICTWFCEGDIVGCNIGLEASNYAPSSDSDEIYTGTEYVPTYQDCGIRDGLYGDYCDYDTTPPIDGGGNYQ